MLLIQMLKNACGCQSTLTELVSPMQSSKIKKKENEDLLKVKWEFQNEFERDEKGISSLLSSYCHLKINLFKYAC